MYTFLLSMASKLLINECFCNNSCFLLFVIILNYSCLVNFLNYKKKNYQAVALSSDVVLTLILNFVTASC